MTKIFLSFAMMCSLGTVSALAAQEPTDQNKPSANKDEALTEYDLNKLALSEMRDGLTAEGLEHERKAMQLYSSKDVAGLRSALGYFGSEVILYISSLG